MRNIEKLIKNLKKKKRNERLTFTVNKANKQKEIKFNKAAA